jgi:hypothetical protein
MKIGAITWKRKSKSDVQKEGKRVDHEKASRMARFFAINARFSRIYENFNVT